MKFCYLDDKHEYLGENTGALSILTRCNLDIVIYFDAGGYSHMELDGFEFENEDTLHALYIKVGDDPLNQETFSLEQVIRKAELVYDSYRDEAIEQYNDEYEHFKYITSVQATGRI